MGLGQPQPSPAERRRLQSEALWEAEGRKRQRLFVNGLKDGALQQHLRLHARENTFPETVEKARIYVEAFDLSPLTLKKPAVRFAQSPTRSDEDQSETYADKILEGINKLLKAAENKSDPKTPPPSDPPKSGPSTRGGTVKSPATNASYNNANSSTGNVRNERGRNFSPTRGRNFSGDRDSRSPTRSPPPPRGNANTDRNRNENSDRNFNNNRNYNNNDDRRANSGYNNNYRGQQNSRLPGSNFNSQNNANSRPYGRQFINSRNDNRGGNENAQNRRPVKSGCFVCGERGCHTWFHQNGRRPMPAETSLLENVRRGIELRDVVPYIKICPQRDGALCALTCIVLIPINV